MVEKNLYHALFCFVDTVLKIIRAVFYVEKRKEKTYGRCKNRKAESKGDHGQAGGRLKGTF